MKKIFILAVAIIMFPIVNNAFFSKTLLAKNQPNFQVVIEIDEPIAFWNDETIVLSEEKTAVPKLIDGQTFVPISLIEEVFQFDVSRPEQTVNIEYNNEKITYSLDNDKAIINGEEISLASVPMIYQGIIYIPLRQTMDLMKCNTYYYDGIILVDSQNIEPTEEDIKKYIVKFAETSLGIKLANGSLNRWQLASNLVDKVLSFHHMPSKNINIGKFKDEILIPEEARKQSKYAIAWQLLNLDAENSFRPFKKIEKAELKGVFDKFSILLDSKPGEYETVSLDENCSSKIKNDLLPILSDAAKNSNLNYFISIYDFATNTHIDFNGNSPFYPASLIKTLYLYTYLEQVENGVLTLDKTHTLSQTDKYASGTKVTGTGSLQYQKNGTKHSYKDLLSLMTSISDNVAANIIMDTIGADCINETAKKYGMDNTRVNRKFYEVASPLSPNSTTARDLNKPLILLENRYVKDSFAQLGIGFMEKTVNKNRIGRSLPETIKIANKTGTISRLGGDMALIYYPDREPIAISMVFERKPSRGFNAGQMELEIGRLAKKIVDYFGQHKNPDLFINGEKIPENIKLRYIEDIPHINITGIDRLSNLDKNKAVIINGNEYCSLPDIREQSGYGFDIVKGSFVHLYSLY